MKYKLEDASNEELEVFKKEMDELLAKLSLNLSLVINKKGISIKLENGTVENIFIDQPTLVIQKKVEIPDTSEPEAPKITEVEATVSPFIPQPNTDETNTATA